MSIEKYYTPTIEEFHVGFEYETYRQPGWVKEIQLDGFLSNKKLENIRVKHLDREDIESFGFEYNDMINDNRLLFFKDVETEIGLESCGLLYVPQTNWVLLYSHIKQVGSVLQGGYVIELPENKITVMGGTRFCGYIKNKSELKRILNQIK